MQPNQEDFIVIQNGNGCEKIPQYKRTLEINLYHYYVLGQITNPNPYLDLINTLKTADEHDTIFIYLNTIGGDLHTAIQIMSAMRQCVGTVITCLEGQACSAGTLIFLTAHDHIVTPNSTFMIHNYNQWLGGKGNELVSSVKYSEQYFKKLFDEVYCDFLTPEEIQAVIDGKDFWMDSDEVLERLTRRSKEHICADADEAKIEAVKAAAPGARRKSRKSRK